MDNLMKLDDDSLYTRGQLREVGLNYSSTQFGRWESAKLLTAFKPGGLPSSRVHYLGREVKTLLRSRVSKVS